MMINGSASWRKEAARARRWLTVSAGVGVAVATLAGTALAAEGETGPSSGSNEPTCPTRNQPNELTLAAGTPQTAILGSAFATNLQVAFTNSNGCPVTTAVAGIPVTFSAPSVGASGLFSASGSNAVTVGSDASGMASAPTFTANYLAGSYTLTASSADGSVFFSLTNAEGSAVTACGAASSAGTPAATMPSGLAGKPAKLTAGVGVSQSTRTGSRFPIHLAVTVTDAEKNPVPGVLVTFMAPSRGPSGYFTVRSGVQPAVSRPLPSGRPGAHPAHPRRVEVKTDACGVALAPTFTANRRTGGYIVVASVERMKAAFALVNEGR